MQGEIDERVPRGGHSLLTVFGAPGAVLGLLFYLVVDQFDADTGQNRLLIALGVGIAFGTATYLLTVLKGQVLRASLTGLGLGLALAALAAVSFEGQGWQMSNGLLPALAWSAVLTVALPFIRAATKNKGFFDYRPLYADAWTLPAIVGIAQVFVLTGAALAALVAALFAFIGLDFLREIMSEPWFIFTYGGLLEAVGVGVVRQREAAILAARAIKMALIRVTAPVFAACATIFVGAVMIRGFGSLIDGLSPVGTLTAAAAVAIIMINAIVADEGRPQNALFGATSRLLGVIIIFLMALAVYGLYMRVAAEGWTPNRLAAAVAVLVFALYAPIYAAAALAERWVILRQGNIAMSAVVVLIAVLICVPVFRPYDWSVASQLNQFKDDPEAVSAFDLVYLRDNLGVPGQAAFAALSEGTGPLAARAREIGDRPAYAVRLESDGDASTEMIVGTDGWELPDALRETVLALIDVGADVILNPLGDGRVLAIVIADFGQLEMIVLDTDSSGGWRVAARDSLYLPDERKDAFLEAAKAGEVGLVVRSYSFPMVGETVIPPAAETLEPYSVEEDLGAEADPAN